MSVHTCLCCSDTLLRHIQSGRIYWFCPHCRQEVPECTQEFSSDNFVKYLNALSLKTLNV